MAFAAHPQAGWREQRQHHRAWLKTLSAHELDSDRATPQGNIRGLAWRFDNEDGRCQPISRVVSAARQWCKPKKAAPKRVHSAAQAAPKNPPIPCFHGGASAGMRVATQ